MGTLWDNNIQRPEFKSLQTDIKTDVLIIGGGIAGILTAYFLHEKGVPYVLVEKDRICSGTTVGTTAKLTFQHGLIYSRLLREKGAEKAGLYLRANRMAFEKYAALCRDIDCDFQFRDNYVYSRSDRRKLESEMDALSRIGFKAMFT